MKCTSLSHLQIPSSVHYIDHSAFDECSSLFEIEIDQSVTSIGPYAFKSCKSLTTIKLPLSLVQIESNIFESCSSYFGLFGKILILIKLFILRKKFLLSWISFERIKKLAIIVSKNASFFLLIEVLNHLEL